MTRHQVRHQLFIGSSTEGCKWAKWLQVLLLDIAKHDLHLDREDFNVIGWWERGVFSNNASYFESIVKQLDETHSALLLATEADKVVQRGKDKYKPRDNIILEYGLWTGRFGREKTAIARVGNPDLPSDLSGVKVISLETADDQEVFSRYNRGEVEQWLKVLMRVRQKLSGKVSILFPSFQDEPFYYPIYVGLTKTLPEAYQPVLSFPDDAYNVGQFIMKFREISGHQDEYAGCIIRPVLVGPPAEELRAIVAEWAIPTVFIDINPYKMESKEDMPEDVCYVGFDNDGGGQLAAKAMLRELRGRTDPQVLVVASDEQPERRKAFCKELKALDETIILQVISCKFSRKEASECVRKAFKQLWEKERHSFDGIFCSSDVMALGANTAVSELFFVDQAEKMKDIAIVGYDGTPQAKDMIGFSGSPFRNTVMQDTYDLGARAANSLVKMMRGLPLREDERVQVLPVNLYVDE